MQVTISNRLNSICLDVSSIRVGGAVDLLFDNGSASYYAFLQIKAMGIDCCYGDEDSPTGPIVRCNKLNNHYINVY